MFDLSNFGAGYCYTYNPPNKTLTDFAHRLFMLLGNREFYGDLLIGFNIYLHEKGQFWPRPDLQAVNGQASLAVPLHTEIEGVFSIKQYEMINKKGNCVDSIDYSFTNCLFKYVYETIQCRVYWNMTIQDPLNCHKNLSMQNYVNVLLFLQRSSLRNLTLTTGCLPKCKYLEYEYEEFARESVDWRTDWISSLYLMPQYPGMAYQVEKYEFGPSDLFSDVGSYLGLFLGWSLLSISINIPTWYTWLVNTTKNIIQKYNHVLRSFCLFGQLLGLKKVNK